MNRFPKKFLTLKDRLLLELRPRFDAIDAVSLQNTARILDAFRTHKVSDFDFRQTTGYGYGDLGRDKLAAIWADIFGAEAALVRSQFVSGTHALSTALFCVLRPGDECCQSQELLTILYAQSLAVPTQFRVVCWILA